MGQVVGSIDVALLVLYAFWIFFAGVLWYLRQEDRREGYPLEADVTGDYNKEPWLFVPKAKEFILPHGHGVKLAPDPEDRDTRPVKAKRTAQWAGSPLVPTGDPMVDGVGPAAWAERADIPDQTPHGDAKIVPLDKALNFKLSSKDPNPIGMSVFGCDGEKAGEISSVWVDQSESVIRYFEVNMGRKKRLIPTGFVKIQEALRGRDKVVYVHAITGDQFNRVPATASNSQVTLLEEDKIMGYFGGGHLYATPDRQEPLL